MHSKGYVHADMKPNNVCVTDDDRVKVIDLGQSCAIGTVKERIQGTPDYIAPEQVHRRPIMPQTDIYNLGATMYWVLTGTHIPTALPKGNSLVGSLDDEFIEKAKLVRELNPDVPERLEELIMQCIQVDIENRPRSMEEGSRRPRSIFLRAKEIASSTSEAAASSGRVTAARDESLFLVDPLEHINTHDAHEVAGVFDRALGDESLRLVPRGIDRSRRSAWHADRDRRYPRQSTESGAGSLAGQARDTLGGQPTSRDLP